ncbi:GtrA family protein [Lysobacter sp. CCNWLW3]|uniref:GtrA family protein n=1 Tax=unclassified Lysobacter TaxID=2635362 RepID=UPI002FD36C7B
MLSRIRSASLRGEALRFLIGGGANTLATYGLYWILLQWLTYPVAYTASYAAGILTGFAINTWFVFGIPWSWRKLMAFPLVHVMNYMAGMAVVWASVRLLRIPEPWAPVVATLVTLPLSFLLTRLLIRSRSSNS